MARILLLLLWIGHSLLQAGTSKIRDHVYIKIYTYEQDGKVRASVLPEIRPGSSLTSYKRRFDYLLINVPDIHKPEKAARRNEILSLYPDTTEIKRLFLDEYVQDENLTAYFEESIAPIENSDIDIQRSFSVYELMEVASKFFYCDKVNADTSIQAHICIGLNGISEANWAKDFILLEAFCYEAIFDDLDKENSQLFESFVSEKKEACNQYRKEMTTVKQYLEDVKSGLFERMSANEVLQSVLLNYYELNEGNLAFRINE